jgi:hypothetical protein
MDSCHLRCLLKPDCVSRLIFAQTARAAISRRALPDKQQKGKRAFFERVDKKMFAFNKAVSFNCAPFGQFVSKELLSSQLSTHDKIYIHPNRCPAACGLPTKERKRESVRKSERVSRSHHHGQP